MSAKKRGRKQRMARRRTGRLQNKFWKIVQAGMMAAEEMTQKVAREAQRFAKGGVVVRGHPGPEIIIIPRGERVVTSSQSRMSIDPESELRKIRVEKAIRKWGWLEDIWTDGDQRKFEIEIKKHSDEIQFPKTKA